MYIHKLYTNTIHTPIGEREGTLTITMTIGLGTGAGRLALICCMGFIGDF